MGEHYLTQQHQESILKGIRQMRSRLPESQLNIDPSQTTTVAASDLQLSVEESHGFLQGVKHNQDILNQDLISLKENIDDMQNVSYDGTFVWKITSFKEKMG
jgi:hypothetical protein